MFFRRRRHPIGDEDLSAYIDGQLSPNARGRLERHLEACDACRDELEELRALREALTELPRAAAPRSFTLREADVRPEPATPRPAAYGRAMALLGGVTAAAFVAFWTLVSVDVLTQPSEQEAVVNRAMQDEGQEASEPDAAEMAPEPTGAEGFDAASPNTSVEEDRAPAERLTPGLSTAPDVGATPGVMPMPSPTPEADMMEETAEDGDRTAWRAAEAATAALALVAGGSLALAWWRRRG